ncbi:hypothetical protein [Caballeronia sp. LZ001]|uniref:hypothetical protein n=1 Tax=Caballeronia sp. LZ001 TaxID=3038553 RepID=UPI00285FF862|nr:hypothetical protein [Caballeronia sp. LZ001]MDR5800881.1 hypothetical protein [Caballeronia sp. LZ001]
MKIFVAIMLLALLSTLYASANSSTVALGPIPAISDVSPKLKKTFDALRTQIESDAKDCDEAAKAMNSNGRYSSSIKKLLTRVR